jgi:hypothetical protein
MVGFWTFVWIVFAGGVLLGYCWGMRVADRAWETWLKERKP